MPQTPREAFFDLLSREATPFVSVMTNSGRWNCGSGAGPNRGIAMVEGGFWFCIDLKIGEGGLRIYRRLLIGRQGASIPSKSSIHNQQSSIQSSIPRPQSTILISPSSAWTGAAVLGWTPTDVGGPFSGRILRVSSPPASRPSADVHLIRGQMRGQLWGHPCWLLP